MLTNEHRAMARYLGADAGACLASWLMMSEGDARTIVEDIDPEVEDRYPPPNLPGEWTDDPTPLSLWHEVTGQDWEQGDDDDVAELADIWTEAAEDMFYVLREAHALRLIGRVHLATRIEDTEEHRIFVLRTKAGLYIP